MEAADGATTTCQRGDSIKVSPLPGPKKRKLLFLEPRIKMAFRCVLVYACSEGNVQVSEGPLNKKKDVMGGKYKNMCQ